MRTIDQTADRIWSDERPLERRQRGTQQRKRCSPSAPPLPRARPSPSTDARSRQRDPSPSAPARYAPPLSFHSSRSSRVRSRVIQPPVATVRSPRRGEIRVGPARWRRATNARARTTRNDGSIFFTSIPTETRPRFRMRGRRARGERRRILGRSRVSPRFYPHARVRSAWSIPTRRGAARASLRSVVPERCVAERSFSFDRSVVRARRRTGP